MLDTRTFSTNYNLSIYFISYPPHQKHVIILVGSGNILFIIIIIITTILSGVRLSPLGTAAATGLLYQPHMIDDGDCGAIGGMRIDSGN
jgi:hypothetical protein